MGICPGVPCRLSSSDKKACAFSLGVFPMGTKRMFFSPSCFGVMSTQLPSGVSQIAWYSASIIDFGSYHMHQP